ncbi:FAD-binding oxidoreductase [Roseitranquillus sediminis]|uniref:FAD-binding oxidoreductase n=1 Tax=Roseitranquillus sediminis TaxID=2809051 RepID=UPI001D0C5C87|nr:FAD-binding oxidoreductase [Roseitranquillus sediminis]MBM9593739.1 FAD-binding oxidoreductase [Roseitranquillus sediminis]
MSLNPVDDALCERLRARLPEAAFRDPAAYLSEPRGTWRGQAGLVVAPANTEEVAEAIRVAGEARVGVVPYGGGTGLVGGQLLQDGPAPLVLSLERMRAVREVLPRENVIVAEAGAVLSDVQAAAQEAERLFPLSLGSQGSARIGGLLATNAGGANVLRYGNARDLVLGLEAVLPDGQIWHGLRRLRKDNTGYDLRHLLVGAEGTLGIITAAALRLFPRPAREGAAMIVVPGPDTALDLLGLAQDMMAGGISAFELISGVGLKFLREMGFDVRQPFDEAPEWCVLIDLGLPAGQDPDAVLEELFADAFERDLALDGVIAQSGAQRQDFWTLRDTIPEANREIGAIASHDISLPLGEVPRFLDAAGPAVEALGPFRINVFGHLGDGNLHYNIFPPKGEKRDAYRPRAAEISRVIHDLVQSHEGSFSAEHGVGRLKVDDLERYGDPAKLDAMRRIKAALDPLGIMNPGAMLRNA